MEAILTFGKFKGQKFNQTPKWYQDWLLKQDWFSLSVQDELINSQRQFSNSYKKLGNWNGYSQKGQAVYDSMFEAEKAMDNAIFNISDQSSPFYDGSY